MFKGKIVKSLVLGIAFSVLISSTVFAETKTSEAVKGTATIDGTMEDLWKTAKEINVNLKQESSKVDNYATAKARTMWDEKYLYVFVEVTDSYVFRDPANQAHETDAVEFFIDENNHKIDTPEGQWAYTESDDSQYRVDCEGAISGGGGFDKDKLKSAVKKTDKGYIVEAAIPFKTEAKEGQEVGFDIQVNDDKEGGQKRDAAVTWSVPDEKGWMETLNFGTLTLVAAAPAPADTKDEPAAPADTKDEPAAPADTKDEPAAPADTKAEPAAPVANPSTGDASALAYLAMAGVSGAALLGRKKMK